MPMIGSPAVAALIAQLIFWLLLAVGWATRELGARGVAVFVVLWLAGFFGLPRIPYEPAHALFSSVVAVLDIALVFTVLHGDVRLT
jgi:hypothetical protein